MTNPTKQVTHRILVVDDNPAIHEDFGKILSPETTQSGASVANMMEELFGDSPQSRVGPQFEMDSAFQGQEALAKVQDAEREGRPYSLAFMDVRMPPGWDGIETIARIWKEFPHIQIVICTAYSDYSWEQILKTLGETDSLVILKKPFDSVEVLQLAHTLTKKWVVTRQANARMADLDERVRQRTQELVEANQRLQCEIQRCALVDGALRESEERFHKAFETVSVALAIRPLGTGLCLDVNQSFVKLCGYTREELLGKTFENLSLLEDPKQLDDAIKNLLLGKTITNLELQIRRKDGSLRQTMTSVELLRLGEQSCLLAALLDVTDQKHLEGQLRQAQKMEAIGQLAAGVAHDFNNLLTVIHGYSSLQLAKRNLDTDVAKAFTQVKLASERASALTRQLLAFSRKQVVQRKPIDLSASLTRVQGMLARVLGENIHIHCHSANGLPCINADESNIEQVIMNLSLNARDAMPNGGQLNLTATLGNVTEREAAGSPDKRAGDFVTLTVSDTGCGIDPQTLARIFEPFFTTKPVGRGTGLGLSTVYGIVKQHDGWIEVSSTPGKGTTFRVFLPITREKPSPPEVPVETRANSNPRVKSDDTILVVEDEPDVREFVNLILSAEGYRVLQATSGADALLKWKGNLGNARLLLTDMIMPDGVSGSMLAQRLCRHHPSLKVIYTSGYSPDNVPSGQSLREGLNFISKPFTRDLLLDAVKNALVTPAKS